MDIKKFNLVLVIEMCICIIAAALLYYAVGIEEGMFLLSLPFVAIGKGLRWLSLISSVGNILACLLYGVICMLPSVYLFIKYRMSRNIELQQANEAPKKENKILLKADVLLPIMSLYLFYLIYSFINPGIFLGTFPQLLVSNTELLPFIQSLSSSVIYSLMIGYVTLVFVSNFQRKDAWKRTEQALMICAFIYTAYVCYFLPFQMFALFASGNHNGINGIVTVIKYLLELLPLACFLGIITAGVELVRIIKQKIMDEKAVIVANKLALMSKRTVIVAVVCNIIGNLMQVMLSSQISHTNFILNIPFLPLILAFAGLIIAEHLKNSAILYEDSQMII